MLYVLWYSMLLASYVSVPVSVSGLCVSGSLDLCVCLLMDWSAIHLLSAWSVACYCVVILVLHAVSMHCCTGVLLLCPITGSVVILLVLVSVPVSVSGSLCLSASV